jgi:hypothetical protein
LSTRKFRAMNRDQLVTATDRMLSTAAWARGSRPEMQTRLRCVEPTVVVRIARTSQATIRVMVGVFLIVTLLAAVEVIAPDSVSALIDQLRTRTK